MVGVTIATIVVILSTGGGEQHFLADLKKEVKNNIEDKDRRNFILDESKALSKELKSLGKEIDGHFKDFVKVHADYHATDAEFDTALSSLSADQQAMTKLILDSRDAMHQQMTKAEWEAVFKDDSKKTESSK